MPPQLCKGTPHEAAAAAVYRVGMTLSNAGSSVAAWLWGVRAREAGTAAWQRWASLAVLGCLMYLRQVEAHKLVGPWLWT